MSEKRAYEDWAQRPIHLRTPGQHLLARALIGLALAVALYVVSRANYPLFHCIVDGVTIFIAGSVFLVVWNGRRRLDNHYYLLVAMAFLAFGLLHFMHLVGNKGMGVLPEYGNLGPTFYIAGRYVLGISFLLAPLFIGRKVRTIPVLAVYLLVVELVLLSVLRWRNFPATYIEGTGLTPFKVYSDYAVCLMLLGGLGMLLLKRRAFDARVFKIVAFSLVLSIATGLAFTLYSDPFGITNAVGHFFQIASFALIYMGFVETVLTKPQSILYRSLGESEERLRRIAQAGRIGFVEWNAARNTAYWSPEHCEIFGYEPGSSVSWECWRQGVHPEDRERVLASAARLLERGRAEGQVRGHKDEYRFTRPDGSLVWVEADMSVDMVDGEPLVRGAVRDITERKKAEEVLESERKQLLAIVESLDEAVGVWNTDGSLLLINDATAKLYGFEMKEQMLKHLSDYADVQVRTMDGRELPQEEWPPSRVLRGETFSNWELEQFIPSINKRFIGSNSGRPVRDANGKIILGVTSLRDITERKQAEQELERMRNLLAEGQRVAHVGSFEYVAATQTTVWSEEEFRIYGLDPAGPSPTYEAMLAKCIHPDDAAWLHQAFSAALQSRSVYELEHRIVRPDGSVRWVYDRAQPYLDERGALLRYVGATLDITERKQAEEELAAAHRQLQSVIDNTTSMVYACDLEARFVIANATLAALLETTPAQMLGKRRHEFMPREDADKHEANDREVMAAGRAVDFEEHSELHGRSITWLSTKFPLRDAQGRICAVAGIVTDITERKRAEEALRESEERFRVLTQNLVSAVALINERGEICIVNHSFLRLFELGEDADLLNINSRDWSRWQVSDEAGRLLAVDEHPVRKAARTRTAVKEVLVALQCPGRARRKWVLISAEPILDAQGNLHRLVCTYHDITARKDAEDAVRASLAEKEVLLKEVHHRVKNNMQVLASLVSLQEESLRGKESLVIGHSSLDNGTNVQCPMTNNAAQPQMTNDQLLAAFADVRDRIRSMALVHESLYQSENLANIDFADYAGRMTASLARAHGRGISGIRLTLDVEPVTLAVESAVPCGLILNELVTNAFKHAFRDRATGEIMVRLRSDPTGRVSLVVRDDGNGLPAGLDWRQASSLGLRLVQMLTRQIRGMAEVRVPEGGGTEFRVEFAGGTGER